MTPCQLTNSIGNCVSVTPHHSQMGLPRWSVVKNLPANAEGTRDSGLMSGLGRSPGGGNSNPLQYSCLNPMDSGVGQWSLTGYSQQLSMHTHDLI